MWLNSVSRKEILLHPFLLLNTAHLLTPPHKTSPSVFLQSPTLIWSIATASVSRRQVLKILQVWTRWRIRRDMSNKTNSYERLFSGTTPAFEESVDLNQGICSESSWTGFVLSLWLQNWWTLTLKGSSFLLTSSWCLTFFIVWAQEEKLLEMTHLWPTFLKIVASENISPNILLEHLISWSREVI